MKLNSRHTLAIFALLIATILFDSCKKRDISNQDVNGKPELSEKEVNERSTAAVLALAAKSPKATTWTKNLHVRILPPSIAGQQRTNTTCFDPGIDENYIKSLSLQKIFYCEAGANFKITWEVSTVNTLNLASSNGSFSTSGRIRFKNSSNTILQTTNVTSGNITISSPVADTDPNYPNNHIFTITYTTPRIDESVTSATASYENSMPILATNCADLPYMTLPAQTITFGVDETAVGVCERNDLIFINPVSYANNNCASGTIYNHTSLAGILASTNNSCGFDYDLPTYHDIQWREVNGSGTPVETWGSNANHGTRLTVTGIFNFVLNTNYERCKRYEFRYRNIVTDFNGNITCATPTWTSYGIWDF